MPPSTRSPDWHASALCAQTDPDLWFPETGASCVLIAAAKRICHQCPVRNECLEEGVKARPESGIWGGYTTFELRTVRRVVGEDTDLDDLTALSLRTAP